MRKNKLKIIFSSLLLSASVTAPALIMTSAPPFVVAAEAAQTVFSDVANSKSWYYDAVYWAAEKGITSGQNGKFLPNNYCTREQVAAFLWRAAGKSKPKSSESPFSDFKNKSVYSYNAVLWANENGIITGSGGKFSPGNICTRQQVVTMLWRLAGKPLPKSLKSPFKDVTNPSSYSYKAILWASENGITTGQNGMFDPDGKCTRAHIVTFIYRYFQKSNGWKTEGGKKYYYKDGKKLTGLQKIDDTWYLFDKSTGEYMNESGKKLYVGSFFGSNNGAESVDKYNTYYTKSYKFLTFDGTNLHALTNADYTYNNVWPTEKDSSTYKSIFTQHGGRDSSMIMKDGMFFTAFTGYSSTAGSGRDFTILNTPDFITYSWGAPSTHYEYSESRTASGGAYRRGSPEWFTDTNKKTYVFYSAQVENSGFAVYMTQLTGSLDYAMNSTYDFSAPIRINFNGAPKVNESEVSKGAPETKPIDKVIDPCVIKVGNSYYMIVKRESWFSGNSQIKNLQASLMVYKAKDSSLKSWDFLYEFDNFKLPYNNGSTYDYYTGEGSSLKYINGKYFLYLDVYGTKSGSNYYEGIHYFTTDDITKPNSWIYGGKLTADNQFGYKNLRHGSINEITDELSEEVIKTLYNGVVEVPDISFKYTGEELSFVKYLNIFWGKPIGSAFYEVKDGTWKATEKGTYSVTVELKSDKLKWSDGGSRRRNITWRIV